MNDRERQFDFSYTWRDLDRFHNDFDNYRLPTDPIAGRHRSPEFSDTDVPPRSDQQPRPADVGPVHPGHPEVSSTDTRRVGKVTSNSVDWPAWIVGLAVIAAAIGYAIVEIVWGQARP